MNLHTNALAVTIAALDGHDPNLIRDTDGSISQSTDARENTDLDLAILDLLYRDISTQTGDFRRNNCDPAVGVRQVALTIPWIVFLIGETLGVRIDRAMLADQLRKQQANLIAAEHNGDNRP